MSLINNSVKLLEYSVEYLATKTHSWEALTLKIVLATLFFGGIERILVLKRPKQWLTFQFKKAGKVESKDLDQVFWQASSRIVGLVHLIIQIPLGAAILLNRDMQSDPLYATTNLSFLVAAISSGYFCFDLYVCIFRWEGPSYLLHGFTCSTLFCYCALTGFLHYYAAMFLMWELSTPFVYARWFLYNLGQAGSKLYLANGLAMVISFFCARNVLGLFMLLSFFNSTEVELARSKARKHALSAIVMWTYCIACLALTGLNALWFYKMFRGAIKVFTSPRTADKVEQETAE